MRNSLFILILFIYPASKLPALELDLLTAERLAVKSSRELRTAAEQLELSLLASRLNIRDLLPVIELNTASSRQVNFFAPDSDVHQLGITIDQILFNGGRTAVNREIANIHFSVQSSKLRIETEELRDEVWQLFYGLLLSSEKLLLQKELLEISEEQLAVALKKLKMGALTELDYLESELEIRTMKIDIIDTENKKDSMQQDFAFLLGLETGTSNNNPMKLSGIIDREYSGLPLHLNDSKTYENILTRNNPELQSRQASLREMQSEYKLSQSSFLPVVSLSASFFIRGPEFPLQETGTAMSLKVEFPELYSPLSLNSDIGITTPESRSRGAGGSVSIFPKLDFVVNSRAGKQRLSQAEEELEEYSSLLKRRLRQTIDQLENNRRRLEINRDSMNIRKQRLDILETRGELGQIKDQDLLKARIDYYQAEIAIREQIIELMRCEREFEKLLGLGLGQLETITATAADSPIRGGLQ